MRGNYYPPGNEHIPSQPALFEAMIFLFPRWDMDSFPGGYLILPVGYAFYCLPHFKGLPSDGSENPAPLGIERFSHQISQPSTVAT